jgi:hypothetical protein
MAASIHRCRRLGLLLALVAATGLLAGCGWFGKDSPGKSISAFDIKVGQCFTPPSEVKAEIATITVLPCSTEHTEEAYSIEKYSSDGAANSTASDSTASYPGADVLTTFANSVCAQNYADYVGVPYTDSSLYFTYLLPSARSWESGGDRSVICFVTTTGQKLTASVKNSKR